jgi:hypothetical protein
MAMKAINDTADPEALVPTLLVYGAYPRMNDLDPPTPSMTQRAKAIKHAMEEITKIRAKQQVNTALNYRNGPSKTPIHDTPLNSPVIVWREGNTGRSGNWTGLFKLLEINDETCHVELLSRPTEFWSTAVKPYYQTEPETKPKTEPEIEPQTEPETEPEKEDNNQEQNNEELEETNHLPNEPRWNPKRGRQLPNRFRQNVADITVYLGDYTDPKNKKRGNNKKVRKTAKNPDNNKRGKTTITPETPTETPKPSFVKSRRKEIDGLLTKGAFELAHESEVPVGTRIFGSRFVDKVKNSGTAKAFEKSRLVVQAYNDQGKDLILTQSPAVQRVSQRIILALAMTLHDKNKKRLGLYLHDISQTYVQSRTPLARDFFARPPPELGLETGTILKIVRPFYELPEAGNYWFQTYHHHHREKLRMAQSTYDPCLLFTPGSPENKQTTGFGVVSMQTDDTLLLADSAFVEVEENELRKAY